MITEYLPSGYCRKDEFDRQTKPEESNEWNREPDGREHLHELIVKWLVPSNQIRTNEETICPKICPNLTKPAATSRNSNSDTTEIEPRKPLILQGNSELKFWGRVLTVGCPVVVSPLPREWSCLYRRGEGGISFLKG